MTKINRPLSGAEAAEFLRSIRAEGKRQAAEDAASNAASNAVRDEAWGGKAPTGGLRYKPIAEGVTRRLASLRGLHGSGENLPVVVSLLPSNEIEFREKGGRKRLRLSLEVVIVVAAKAEGEREIAARKAAKAARKG